LLLQKISMEALPQKAFCLKPQPTRNSSLAWSSYFSFNIFAFKIPSLFEIYVNLGVGMDILGTVHNIKYNLFIYQVHYKPVLDSTHHTINIVHSIHVKKWFGSSTTKPHHCILETESIDMGHLTSNLADRPGVGGGVIPRKIWYGGAARFPKPLPYLWQKSVIFPTLFMTWPKIWYPIYDLTRFCSWLCLACVAGVKRGRGR